MSAIESSNDDTTQDLENPRQIRVMPGNFPGTPPAVGIAIGSIGTILGLTEARIFALRLLELSNDDTPSTATAWSSERQSEHGPAVRIRNVETAAGSIILLRVAHAEVELPPGRPQQLVAAIFEQLARTEADGQTLDPSRASERHAADGPDS